MNKVNAFKAPTFTKLAFLCQNHTVCQEPKGNLSFFITKPEKPSIGSSILEAKNIKKGKTALNGLKKLKRLVEKLY